MVRIIRVPYLLAYPQDEYAAQVLLPNIIFVRRGEILTPNMVAHELAHIDQLARYGLIGYWARYVWWLARGYGHDSHPMEAEARAYEWTPAGLARAMRALSQNRE